MYPMDIVTGQNQAHPETEGKKKPAEWHDFPADPDNLK